MKKEKTKLIVDGNLLARKSFYKFKDLSSTVKIEDLKYLSKPLRKKLLLDIPEDIDEILSTKSGNNFSVNKLGKIESKLEELSKEQEEIQIPTGVMYGMLRSILLAVDRFNIGEIVICYDPINYTSKETEPQIRRTLNPKYKDRKKDPETEAIFFDSLFIAISFFNKLSIKQVTSSKYEADDILHYFTHKVFKDDKCLVMTNDHDLYQLLVPNRVTLLRQGMDPEIFTASLFKDQYGISPKQWHDVQSLGGCQTDNVGGIYGISHNSAIELIRQFKSLKNLITLSDKSKIKKRSRSALEREYKQRYISLKSAIKLTKLYGLEKSLKTDLSITKSLNSSETNLKATIFLLNLLSFKSFLTKEAKLKIGELIKNQQKEA